jgi:hypothetical protein
MNSRYNYSNNLYIYYFDKEDISTLDLNTLKPGEAKNGINYPYLYKNPDKEHPLYLAEDGRNMQMKYVIGKERDNHAFHSSRFSYDNGCELDYCSGVWPGRYQTSGWCSNYVPQPPNTAPSRFYGQNHQGPFNSSSQAQVDYSKYMRTFGIPQEPTLP